MDLYMYLDAQGGILPSHAQIASPPHDPFKRGSGGIAIPLISYSFDILRFTATRPGTQGQDIGKAAFQPLEIAKLVDVNSPTLFKISCAGTRLKYADLLLVGPPPNNTLVAYGLDKVMITAMSHSGSSEGETNAVETVSFEFEQLSVGYATQGQFRYTTYDTITDKPPQDGSATWDNVTNVSGTDAPPLTSGT